MHQHITIIFDEIHFFRNQEDALHLFNEHIDNVEAMAFYTDTSHAYGLTMYHKMITDNAGIEWAHVYHDSEVSDGPTVN